jgi:hypothetical protein
MGWASWRAWQPEGDFRIADHTKDEGNAGRTFANFLRKHLRDNEPGAP